MLHLLAIVAGTGAHYLVILRASTWPTREHRSFADARLAVEVRVSEALEFEERNEANAEHGVTELMVLSEHMSHIFGG